MTSCCVHAQALKQTCLGTLPRRAMRLPPGGPEQAATYFPFGPCPCALQPAPFDFICRALLLCLFCPTVAGDVGPQQFRLRPGVPRAWSALGLERPQCSQRRPLGVRTGSPHPHCFTPVKHLGRGPATGSHTSSDDRESVLGGAWREYPTPGGKRAHTGKSPTCRYAHCPGQNASVWVRLSTAYMYICPPFHATSCGGVWQCAR